MMDQEFNRKRITQSDYRGGSSKARRDGTDGYLNLDLSEVPLKTDKQREMLRAFIVEKVDVMLVALFPEESLDSMRKSSYLDRVFEQLGL